MTQIHINFRTPRAWRNFYRLHKIFCLTTKQLRGVERAFVVAKEAATTREDGTAARLEAAKEEYNLAFVLSNSLMEYHLYVKKDGDE